MTIQTQIKEDLRKAMVSNNMAIKSILRVLLGEFDRVGKEVTDDQAMNAIKKMVENAVQQKNKVEEEILSVYLPKQLNSDELSAVISQLIEDKNYTSIKDMGKIMADLKGEFSGRYDGKLASELIKKKF